MAAKLAQSSLSIKLIAGACALGTGMVAVATALSSPASFLLIMVASMILNYGSVFFHHLFSKVWGQKTFTQDQDANYLKHVLRNREPLKNIPSTHAGQPEFKDSLAVTLMSLFSAGVLAVAAYFFFLYLIPPAVTLYSVAVMLFFPIVFVVYRAFRRGLEDVWNGLQDSQAAPESTEFNSRQWLFVKSLIIGVGVVSCIAAGFLGSSVVQEGVATTAAQFFGLLGMGLSALSGPVGWFMFGLLFIAVTAIMARSVMMFVNDDSLKEKVKLQHALFNREAYLADLEADWQALNNKIAGIQGQLNETQDPKKQADFHEDLNILYGLKDTLYHRYTLFSKAWFQPIFTGVTFLLSSFCLLGMLAHMARGAHSGIEIMSDVMGTSEQIAQAIAKGIIAVGVFAETLFTVTNVADSMIEEGIGLQSQLYDQKLQTQETFDESASRFAYGSSRIQHSLFDWGLVANGASGHGGGGTGYPFADRLGMVGELGAAARAAAERDPAPLYFRWGYERDHSALLELEPIKPDTPSLGA